MISQTMNFLLTLNLQHDRGLGRKTCSIVSKASVETWVAIHELDTLTYISVYDTNRTQHFY